MSGVRVAAYAVVLAAGFSFNAFCIPSGVYWTPEDWSAGEIGYDSDLPLNNLHAAAAGTAGWVEPLILHDRKKGRNPYRSQFGAQGVVLSAVLRATGADPDRFAAVAAVLMGFSTGVGFGLVFASAAAWIGRGAANVAVGLTACSTMLAPFAVSLYWCMPLMLAPFVFAWLCYPWAVRSNRWMAVFLAVTAGLVSAKCLCGYEYVTAAGAAPAAAVAFHAARTRAGLFAWVRHTALIVVVVAAGAALALAAHIGQRFVLYGPNGPDAIWERAALRLGSGTGSDEIQVFFFGPAVDWFPQEYAFHARCVLNFFWQTAVSTPATWGRVYCGVKLVWVVAAVFGIGLVCMAFRRRVPNAAALAPAAAVGLSASVSWLLLARNHTCVHAHLNQVVFHVPFLVIGFLVIGAGVQAVAGALGRGRWADAAFAFAAVAAVAGNGVAMHRRAAAEEDGRGAAERRVAEVLAGTVALTPDQVPCIIEMAGRQEYLPYPGFLPDSRRLLPEARGPAHPCYVVNGVTYDEARHKSLPTARLVAAQGTTVLPSSTRYYSRPDHETGNKHRFRRIGFQSTFSLAGSDPVRLFLVWGKNWDRVHEMPVQ